MGAAHASWGRYPRPERQSAVPMAWRNEPLPAVAGMLLPRGMGRSYGDSCLNEGNTLLLARPLDRLVSFDAQDGVLCCEAGVTLDEILRFAVPRGWFLPVTPGTKFVTVGGAIANDVHGKNHEHAGSFGNHVLWLELLRSDGARLRCATDEHTGLFHATIGGLGLTGLITCACLQLVRIPGACLAAESIRFRSLAEFLELGEQSRGSHEFTVAWLDCGGGPASGQRGLFSRANWSAGALRAHAPRTPLAAPPWCPPGLLNRWTVAAFNELYFRRQRGERIGTTTHYDPFFYPLDAVAGWNRIYGPAGFMQHQCVLPRERADALVQVLDSIRESGQGSFLCVLKEFGDAPSRGMLSFPRPGITLALDFPFRGKSTLALLERLDTIVFEAGGALYPAKDARMAPSSFRRSFPRIDEFTAYVDPAFSSSFWRRVTGGIR